MRARTHTLRARAGLRVHDAFGRALLSASRFAAPGSVDELAALLQRARAERLPVTLRGAGRSYGDASLGSNGLVIDGRGLDHILSLDAQTGQCEVEGGVTIEQLWRASLPLGLWPAVVPGTMRPTLAGCLSSNVHGKNAFRAGPIGEHVLSFDLLTAAGELRLVDRARDPALFHAAIGGMGLLGAIVRVRLQLKKVESGRLRVLPVRVRSLDEQLAVLEENLPTAAYLVSWIDAFAQGRALGRGVLHRADDLHEGEDPLGRATLLALHQDLPPRIFGVPRALLATGLNPFVNPFGLRLLNTAKYESARLGDRRPFLQSHVAFAFLLDYVPEWREAYGPGGFFQVQLFVPREDARRSLGELLKLCQQRERVPSLAVLKRHRPDAFLLSHGLDGYSLALDFKLPRGRREELFSLAHALHARTLDAGGRFYLAKDAALNAHEFARSVGRERLAAFAGIKKDLDPEGLFESDLSRRLEIGK